MTFRIILLILGLVVLYKLIFNVIIPVLRVSRDMRRRFRDINDQMSDRMTQPMQDQANFRRPEASKPKSPEYIDYEEVK